MANTRSAEKQYRQAEKARARNRATKTRLRTTMKKTRGTIAEGNPDDKTLNETFSAIDRAAKKGVIKKNTANRYKSRLTKATKKATGATKA